MYLSSWSGHVWSENQGICINQSLTFVKRSMFSGKQKQNTRTTITKTRTTTRPKDQILLREHFTGRITFVQSRNKFVCNARSCPHKSRPSLATNIIRESVVICSPTHIGETLWSKEWGVKRMLLNVSLLLPFLLLQAVGGQEDAAAGGNTGFKLEEPSNSKDEFAPNVGITVRKNDMSELGKCTRAMFSNNSAAYWACRYRDQE